MYGYSWTTGQSTTRTTSPSRVVEHKQVTVAKITHFGLLSLKTSNWGR